MILSVSTKPKVIIFIVAYCAESTLKQVLERIPAELFDTYDCEVLVVDDASNDRTMEVGREYRDAHPELRMTVLRNEYNQGYGGNQKVGYTYAISRHAHAVALLHGDAQYAPELLPTLLEPVCQGRADAVFGSRMSTTLGAIKGGMPLYKYLGNRILSHAQNALLGSRLSEFHSGYRVYSVPFLEKLQFRLNSNDFHFDTEIIIQLMNARARILELPIPTYYGDEICRVNGMKYAWDVMRVTLQNVAHQTGILYQRRFDQRGNGNVHYDLKLGYPSSHTYALESVPQGARVLDIGSGPGGLARELLKKHCTVTVVDQHAHQEELRGVQKMVQDLEDGVKFDAAAYDYLLLLDVIEHLKDPELFLERLRTHFDHVPKRIILTTPNVAFLAQRVMLLLGQFNYGKAGILDRTHTRLFTFGAFRRLLRDEGFRVKAVRGVPAPFPKVLGNGLLGRAAIAVNVALIRLSKTVFSYQIFMEVESTPAAEFLVQDACAKSSDGNREAAAVDIRAGVRKA